MEKSYLQLRSALGEALGYHNDASNKDTESISKFLMERAKRLDFEAGSSISIANGFFNKKQSPFTDDSIKKVNQQLGSSRTNDNMT